MNYNKTLDILCRVCVTYDNTFKTLDACKKFWPAHDKEELNRLKAVNTEGDCRK